MKRCRLHILGPSGAGVTTLGRAVADAWSVPHADSDDYFWVPTSPPYEVARTVEERLALMWAVFVPREAWVLSGAMTQWGHSVVKQADAVVFLTLSAEERLHRLEARESVRRGDANLDDHDKSWTDFRDWAMKYDDPSFCGRSRVEHELWLENLSQPVLRLNSAQAPQRLLDAVLKWNPV